MCTTANFPVPMAWLSSTSLSRCFARARARGGGVALLVRVGNEKWNGAILGIPERKPPGRCIRVIPFLIPCLSHQQVLLCQLGRLWVGLGVLILQFERDAWHHFSVALFPSPRVESTLRAQNAEGCEWKESTQTAPGAPNWAPTFSPTGTCRFVTSKQGMSSGASTRLF